VTALWFILLLCVTMAGPTDPAAQSGTSASDAQVRVRLAQAEVVVAGVVSSTAQVARPGPPFLSQHDPDWWRATIDVETVEKGQVASKTVTALFANSTDVAWFRSPKLQVGDHRVLILQKTDPFGKPLQELAVVDPLDVQPLADVERIRTLLKTGDR
jgi:hypothetical protein